MGHRFKCFIRIFNTDDNAIQKAYDHTVDKVFGTVEEIPSGTIIEIGEWNDLPQIEILGVGDDNRCSFCHYFREMVGLDRTKRNNCPFGNDPPSPSCKTAGDSPRQSSRPSPCLDGPRPQGMNGMGRPTLKGLLGEYCRLVGEMDTLKEQQNELRDEMRRLMDADGLKKWRGDEGLISVTDKETTRVDNTRLRSLVPQELIDKVTVVTHSNQIYIRPAKVKERK